MKNELATIKNEVITSANAATALRTGMRKKKALSRAARKLAAPTAEGNVRRHEANRLMGEALDLWGEANESREDRRALHLAYAYLKGNTYHQCEATCRKPADFSYAAWKACLGLYGEVANWPVGADLKMKAAVLAWGKAGDTKRIREPVLEVAA